MSLVRLRLRITYDYLADPVVYGTDDPYEMARLDFENLIEGRMSVTEFLNLYEDDERLSFAIEPLP